MGKRKALVLFSENYSNADKVTEIYPALKKLGYSVENYDFDENTPISVEVPFFKEALKKADNLAAEGKDVVFVATYCNEDIFDSKMMAQALKGRYFLIYSDKRNYGALMRFDNKTRRPVFLYKNNVWNVRGLFGYPGCFDRMKAAVLSVTEVAERDEGMLALLPVGREWHCIEVLNGDVQIYRLYDDEGHYRQFQADSSGTLIATGDEALKGDNAQLNDAVFIEALRGHLSRAKRPLKTFDLRPILGTDLFYVAERTLDNQIVQRGIATFNGNYSPEQVIALAQNII